MSSLSRTLDMKIQLFPLPKVEEEVCGLSKKIDDLLTKELQSLSIQTRTMVQEEVHGVTNLCPKENRVMMEEALKSMGRHLDAIQDKHVYDQLSPLSYLHTREWKLKFLRSELYDCKKAAERLVRFTEYMHQEYDLEVLERPLRLSDLETKCGPRSKEVMNSFKSGHSQLLPFRDRSGRRVMAAHIMAMSFDAEIRYKIFQYLWLVACEDEETQRNGIVLVLWGIGEELYLPDPCDLTKTRQLADTIPLRIACVHQCFHDTPIFQFYRAVFVMMMDGTNNKMRMQTHLGSSSCEIRYRLMGYGIPVDYSNNLKTKHLHLWMRGRRVIELQQEETMRINNNIGGCSNVVDCPALADVVFRAGTSSLSHPGNSSFHDMLRCLSDGSQISPETVDMIFNSVTRRNGRFLEWNSCGFWTVISDPVAIQQKIYRSFFYAKRSSNQRRHRQNNSSSTFLFERQDGRKRKRAADGTEISSCEQSCRF